MAKCANLKGQVGSCQGNHSLCCLVETVVVGAWQLGWWEPRTCSKRSSLLPSQKVEESSKNASVKDGMIIPREAGDPEKLGK